MRVKRLEVQGFKSFKDKTVIHFDHGITGIVGPNGCGKSNIVDAFFWVMGEQSYKHMRGSGSDDLIFNGSSKFSPLGMAEATLVLETDAPDAGELATGATVADIPIHLRAKEVSVTRRLYRGGEGEYFMNGVPARLKDIQEMFMDTGVGAKGYSVIEQGQIGKIVNSKPEERRLLIEEAAGIAKYKARKKESLRKMEATQANLSRLNDIIQEIERSLGSLERQAQKARQYRKYKDELLDKEMTWGRRKTLVLRQRLESLRKDKDVLEQEMVGLRAELNVAENEMEVERATQLTDTKSAEDYQAVIQNLSDELANERSALELSRRRQSDLTSQREALETEKQDLATAIEAKREEMSARETESEQSSVVFEEAARNAQLQDEIVRRTRQETETARRKLETDRRELIAGIAQASDLNSQAARLASRIESAREQAERLREQVEEQQARLETSREESERARIQAEETREKRARILTEKQEQSATVQAHEQQAKSLDRERDQSMRALTQLKSRLTSLEELAETHEGFSDGPRAALDWAKSEGQGDKLIALASALDVESNEFDVALQGWLEDRLESLITREASFAAEVISQVGDAGRVAIQIRGERAQIERTMKFSAVHSALEAAGFAIRGELADFATLSPSLGTGAREIAADMIAGVAVVESFAPMTAFLAKGGANQLGGWSVVALDGSALDADGSVRGGNLSADGAAGLIKRKRAITELQTQVAQSETVFTDLETRATVAHEAVEMSRVRLQALNADFQALEVEGAALDRDVHQMSRSLRELEQQLGNSQRDLERSSGDAEAATAERATIEDRLTEILSSRTELEERISHEDAALATREASLRDEEEKLQKLRVDEAQLRERASSLKRELEADKAMIADRQKRVADLDRILERAIQEQEQFSGGESGLATRIEELTRTLGEQRSEYAIVKDRLEQAAARLNASLERIKHLHHTGDQKSAGVNSATIEFEKLSGELQHLIQNLEEKYGPGCLERPLITPVAQAGTAIEMDENGELSAVQVSIQEEMTDTVVTTEMSAEEELILGEEVERLRERIRRLGEVNVGAIEEYEELKKRYDYLVGEKFDLERSIDNLQDAIEHINKTSEERFRKAFEAIADRFERLFPIVFGGGFAKLSLVYPEGSTDILEAGVDILAQPPGKKIVNIALLSGGEKALTAVSLIFAIFMVKPSPFCLLDEVDAPLDDANIGKFNALLREMSAKSQFILITHNKKTMELNDTLYGVTMEEPGVSKMVSITLQ